MLTSVSFQNLSQIVVKGFGDRVWDGGLEGGGDKETKRVRKEKIVESGG